jgi:hypothetical protein
MILGPGTGKQLNARKHPNRPKSLDVLGLGSAFVGAGLQPGVCTRRQRKGLLAIARLAPYRNIALASVWLMRAVAVLSSTNDFGGASA